MNLFDNIIQSQFTKFNGGQSQQLPTFTTPQAPKQINYIPNSIKKVSQSPYGSNPVDNSNSFFSKLLTPFETGVKAVSQNIQQGGQQLSDIAMQHSQSAIDRGYNQGYIDLGQKIKAKHPQYSDISDEELGRKIVAKYPQYQDIVDAGSGIASNPISGTLASVESGLSKGLGTMFQGISNLGSAPLQETGTAGVTRFAKGALETGLGSAQTATSIMPTTLGAKALVAPTVNTLFSTDTAGKVLQPVTQGIETGIRMGQSALGFNPESSVSKDIQNIGSIAGNLALFAGAQKGGAKGYDLAKPLVNKAVQKVSNIPNPVTGAKNVITREIPVGIMERDLSLTPTERASIETINGKPAGAVALEYNLPKDKQAMADTLSVKADEAYNGITSDLKNITTRTESAPAKEMLGIMLDEMAGSPILVRTMKPYMEKLQSMMEQSDYSLAEKNAIRRDFDRIVANKIFDSKGRVSGIEDKAIANIREGLSTQLQNEAMQYGIDIKGKNDILRTSIALRDGVLRRLSQENKNNKIGLQDIGVGAIFGAGDPFTTASVIFGKKVLENSAPGIAQRLYNSNKTPYATSNLKRGVTISPRDTTNGLSIAPDSVPPVRIPVEKKVVKPIIKTPKVAPKNDTPIIKKPLVTPKKPTPNTIKNESKVTEPVVVPKKTINAPIANETGNFPIKITEIAKKSKTVDEFITNLKYELNNSYQLRDAIREYQKAGGKDMSYGELFKFAKNAKQKKLDTNASDTIPDGYFKNAFGEIQKNPTNKKGGFIKIPEIGKKSEGIKVYKGIKKYGASSNDINIDARRGLDTEIGNLISEELKTLPSYEGRTIRTSNSIFGKDISEIKIGDIVSDKGFLSSSKNKSKIWGDYGDKEIIINSKTGKDITKIKGKIYDKYEPEILFDKNTKFVVKNIKGNTVYIEEQSKSPVKNPLVEEARKSKDFNDFWFNISDSTLGGMGQQYKGIPTRNVKLSDFNLGDWRKGFVSKKINQSQTQTGQERIDFWKNKIKKGEMPPVILREGGSDLQPHFIEDGHNRLRAYEQLGIEEVPVIDKKTLREFYTKNK